MCELILSPPLEHRLVLCQLRCSLALMLVLGAFYCFHFPGTSDAAHG
jgi:hypothetical protein